MFKWVEQQRRASKKGQVDEIINYETMIQGLQDVYKKRLLPLEEACRFHDFHSPKLEDQDFNAKPMVLLVGQYSTGKTTFIKYLLGEDFPGSRIGPEPTTDSFMAVMHEAKEGITPGNALIHDPIKQFKPLAKFGNAFLNKFQCSQLPNPVLKGISIVDTPGILAGEEQRVDRGYDFTGVVEWFAERVDRILLLFDAHKLDISDEFRRSIEALRGHDDKIRIVLNKADMVDHQQLMRVHGALMWSLSKVLKTPEVVRVYVGSFWDQPLHFDVNRVLFEDEEEELFRDMHQMPRHAALRKLNDLIKRARLAKVHAHIVGEVRKHKVEKIDLPALFKKIEQSQNILPGDFPDATKMADNLKRFDLSKVPVVKPKLIDNVDKLLVKDITELMRYLPLEESRSAMEGIRGGVFEGVAFNSFSSHQSQGVDEGAHETEWVVERKRAPWDQIFTDLEKKDGLVAPEDARVEMYKSKLPRSTLSKIWTLADTDKDGLLDADEFALAMHLMQIKKDGHDLPVELPSHLVPPSKRKYR